MIFDFNSNFIQFQQKLRAPAAGAAVLQGSGGASRKGETGATRGVATRVGGGSDMSVYVQEQFGASRTTPSNVACTHIH